MTSLSIILMDVILLVFLLMLSIPFRSALPAHCCF